MGSKGSKPDFRTFWTLPCIERLVFLGLTKMSFSARLPMYFDKKEKKLNDALGTVLEKDRTYAKKLV